MKPGTIKDSRGDQRDVSRRKAVHLIAAAGLTAAALKMSAGCQGEGSIDVGECAQSMDDLVMTIKGALGPYAGLSVYESITGAGDGDVHYSVFNHIGAPGESVYEKLDAVIRALGGDPAVDSVWTTLERVLQ